MDVEGCKFGGAIEWLVAARNIFHINFVCEARAVLEFDFDELKSF